MAVAGMISARTKAALAAAKRRDVKLGGDRGGSIDGQGTGRRESRRTGASAQFRCSEEVNAGLADHRMKARIADLGGIVLAGSPADFGKLIADDTEKWGKVIRAANIRPE
jgi:hypothetical protein